MNTDSLFSPVEQFDGPVHTAITGIKLLSEQQIKTNIFHAQTLFFTIVPDINPGRLTCLTSVRHGKCTSLLY